jgi:hypothetical protein
VSSLHSKVELASVELKPKDAVVSVVVSDGFAPITVSGAVVSPGLTVQVKLAGLGSLLPAASTARTSKVCGPEPTPR